MNKLFYLATAAVLSLGIVSCSSEEDLAISQGGNVNFSIQLPAEMATRAYSDGTTASTLHYYVYDEDGTDPVYIEGISNATGMANAFDGELKANVSLNLATGKTYSIVFWADAPGNAYYTYDTATKGMTVTYAAGALAQDESRDAFFAYEAPFRVEGAINKNVTLKRPFAQINVGTTDMQAAKDSRLDVKKTSMTVKGVYTGFNLATGAVTGDATDVTLALADIPTEAFPYKKPADDTSTYTYLGMNYVLVNEKTTVDVIFGDDNVKTDDLTFTAVPVQRNYRTNIFGSLLTDPANYTVRIDKNYETPDIDIEFFVWDGKTRTAPEVDNVNKTISITSAAELAGLADLVNGSEDGMSQYSVTLETDINLGGHEWTPIGYKKNDASGKPFKGSFDGKGHTIFNLKVTTPEHVNNFIGLFGSVMGESEGYHPVLKNLVIDGVESYGAAYVGSLVGSAYLVNIENITVRGAVKVEGCYYVGGLAGRAWYGTLNNLTVNANEGSYARNYNEADNYAHLGGVIGITSEGAAITNISSNLDVIGNNCAVGGLFGTVQYNATIRNCFCSGDVSIMLVCDTDQDKWVGGIAGRIANGAGAVRFIDCQYTGKLSSVGYQNKPYADLQDNRIHGVPDNPTSNNVTVE